MKARKRRPKRRKRGKTKPKVAPAENSTHEDGFERKRGPDAGTKVAKIYRATKQPRQRKSG